MTAVKILTTFTLLFIFTHIQAEIFTISNTNDAGPGSLRDAMIQANADLGPQHVMNFNLAPGSIIDITSHSAETSTGIPIVAFPIITNTVINGNGVILRMIGNHGRYLQYIECIINDLTFDGGTASLTGGALYAAGGINQLNRVHILNCIAGNPIDGGFGGAIRLFIGATLTMTHSTIRNNSAERGAAIWTQPNSILNLDMCTIANNTAFTGPNNYTLASIYVQGELNISNSIIANTIPEGAADIYIAQDFGFGGSIVMNENNIVEYFDCILMYVQTKYLQAQKIQH